MRLLMGTSLSMCIASILKGDIKLSQVFGIVSNTCIKDDISMLGVMKSYAESYWEKWEWDEFEPIVWELFHNRYFEQPRLTGGFQYVGKRGLWMPVTLTYTRYIISHQHVGTSASGICLCANELVQHIDFVDGDRWALDADEIYGQCEPSKYRTIKQQEYDADMKALEDEGLLQVVSL